MIGIYKITSPSGRVYIGQSIDIERRWKSHKKSINKFNTKLYKSFRKYGVEKHIFDIIEECDEKNLDKRELYWQKYYDTVNNGLNCEYVIFSASKHVRSDYVRNKISKTMKTISKTDDHKLKIEENRIKGNNHYSYKEVISFNNETKQELKMGLCETAKYFNVKYSTIKRRCEFNDNMYVEKIKDWHFKYNFDYKKNDRKKRIGKKELILCVNNIKKIKDTLTYSEIFEKYGINKKTVLNKIKNYVIHEYDEINNWEFSYKNKYVKKIKYVFYSRKFILDLETGIYYYSVLDLSNSINKTVSSINNMLNRPNNKFNKRYIYVKNNK